MKFRALLLIAALVFAQWASVAHASEHHALAGKHHCALCLQAQPLDAGAVAAPVTPEFAVAGAIRVEVPVASVAIASPHVYRSRAPPAYLA